jgi:hypothetical protein
MIVSFDGRTARLRRAGIEDGKLEDWWAGESPVQSGVADQQTGVAYLSLVDPRERKDLGIWSLSGRGAVLEQISKGRADLGDVQSGAGDAPQHWTRQLLLAPDGERLIVVDCLVTCDIRGVNIDGTHESIIRSGIEHTDILGLDDRFLFGAFDCATGRCVASSLDLGTGAIRRVELDTCGAGPGIVIPSGPDGWLLVLTTSVPTRSCNRLSEIKAIDLASGATIDVLEEAGDPGNVPSLLVPSRLFSFTLPSDSVLVSPGSEVRFDGTTWLVSLRDRTSTPVLAAE